MRMSLRGCEQLFALACANAALEERGRRIACGHGIGVSHDAEYVNLVPRTSKRRKPLAKSEVNPFVSLQAVRGGAAPNRNAPHPPETIPIVGYIGLEPNRRRRRASPNPPKVIPRPISPTSVPGSGTAPKPPVMTSD